MHADALSHVAHELQEFVHVAAATCIQTIMRGVATKRKAHAEQAAHAEAERVCTEYRYARSYEAYLVRRSVMCASFCNVWHTGRCRSDRQMAAQSADLSKALAGTDTVSSVHMQGAMQVLYEVRTVLTNLVQYY